MARNEKELKKEVRFHKEMRKDWIDGQTRPIAETELQAQPSQIGVRIPDY